MEYHPIANCFPLLDEERLADMADSISANGLRNPIVLFEGKILDGRNRAAACLLAGVEPHTIQFSGTTSEAISLVRDENLQRRDLTSAQRAAGFRKLESVESELAAVVNAIRDEAKGRMKAGKADPRQRIAEGSPDDRRTNTKRAEMAGTNRQYIREADKLADEAPELLDEVAEGKKTMGQAVKALEDRKPQPEEGKKRGVGVIRANEAIDCLKRIPKSDALRERGFQQVADWIRRNK